MFYIILLSLSVLLVGAMRLRFFLIRKKKEKKEDDCLLEDTDLLLLAKKRLESEEKHGIVIDRAAEFREGQKNWFKNSAYGSKKYR